MFLCTVYIDSERHDIIGYKTLRSKLNWDIKAALAGNQTQIYCLEGSNANHYTTNALLKYNITDEALKDYTNV